MWYKTESDKWTNKTNSKQIKIHVHRQQHGGWGRESRGSWKGEGVKYMVTEGDLTLSEGHSVQYTDDMLHICTVETYMILLTTVTPNKLNLKIKEEELSLSRGQGRRAVKARGLTQQAVVLDNWCPLRSRLEALVPVSL